MWASIIAVVGTLAGGLMTGLLQARVSRNARAEDRAAARAQAQLAAVTALEGALADHRRAMWVREELRLTDADQAKVEAARTVSHTTRSAITAPLATVAILAPALAGPARAAAEATYALRNAPDISTLANLRQTALQAADHLVTAASTHLG